MKNDMPWYNVDVKVAKENASDSYTSAGIHVHREMFVNQRNKVNNMCSEVKKNHYKEKLSDVRNQAQFYNIANKLLHRGNTTTLPTYECAERLANDFAHYFDDKAKIIRTKLQEPHPHATSTEPVSTYHLATECHLTTFEPITLD